MAELPASKSSGNINLAEFETAFRELKNELYMKRVSVFFYLNIYHLITFTRIGNQLNSKFSDALLGMS